MTLEGLQNWVLQTGLVVSLLIVLILCIRRPFARMFGANAAYALWSLPLIRLCLPGLSIPENWLPERLRPAPEPAPLLGPSPEFVLEPEGLTTALAVTEAAAEPFLSIVTVLMAVWLSFAAFWLIFQLYQQSRFKAELKAESDEPSPSLLIEIERAAKRVGLRKTPQVRILQENSGPLVTGVLKPLVILPQTFEQTYDLEQRHFALVHEFAHIKRCDLWVALATLIFRAVNWPNPLVHYASHKMRGDQEAACDAFVVKVTGGETAHSYAETLVKAVRQESGVPKTHSHLALSLTETDPEISKGD